MSNKKNDKKNVMKAFVPPMPFVAAFWAWPGKKEDDDNSKEFNGKEQWENFKSNVDTFMGQMKDMQKSSMKATKDQWNTFFAQCMDMQESFATSLPEDAPTFLPISPKEFVKKDKELREMANKFAIEQTDSFLDYAMQSQQYIKDAVSEGVKNVETKIEEKKEAKQDGKKKSAPRAKAAPKAEEKKEAAPKQPRKKRAAPKAEPKPEENNAAEN